MAPRRTTTLIGLLAFIFIAITIYTSPIDPRSLASSAKKHIPTTSSLSLTSFKFPTRPATHEPPVQANSTSGESKWYSDWKWLNPFSSSITLDQSRAVLPPLKDRPTIYTFYEPEQGKDQTLLKAEDDMLLAWRRAWWAAGFKPIVLGRPEAMRNPLYELLGRQELEPTVALEAARWLAWGHMGTGIMASYLCYPMGSNEEHLLRFLRRGEFPMLIRFENLESGLFAGEQTQINDAIKTALNDRGVKHAKTLLDVIPTKNFKVEVPSSLAYYSADIVTSRYPAVAEKLQAAPVEGRVKLLELINSHLHITFQNTFSEGIAVLKPYPEFTTALVSPAARLSSLLAQCPVTLQPTSCPPNNPKCKPCVAAHPMRITQPEVFQNSSETYTIGTVPHPWTFLSLQNHTSELTTRHIRRETGRDTWISQVTKKLLGTGRGGPSRVVALKEAVAGDFGSARSLWFTAEQLPAEAEKSLPGNFLDDLEWHFGFSIPHAAISHGESETPVPGPERRPKPPKPEGPVPTEVEVKKEEDLIRNARGTITAEKEKQGSNRVGVRAVAEAWNMADTEIWQFVRAYK